MATYSDLAAIRNSGALLDRVAVAITKYAQYIIGEATSTTDHNRRFTWAKDAVKNPVAVAAQLANVIVMDPAFAALANGTVVADSISDVSLQSIVETAVNNVLLAW